MKKQKIKITALWLLYALQIVPAVSWILAEFGNALGIIFSSVFNDTVNPAFKTFFEKGVDIGIFPAENFDIVIRLFGAYVLAFLIMIVILIIGRKEVFTGKSPLLLILPFIIEVLTYVVCWSDIIPIWADWTWVIIGIVLLLNIIFVIAVQIYLIIKLVKATKQLKL